MMTPEFNQTLHFDFETRSTVDVTKVGAYAYAMHPTTEIICVAYAVDDEPVQVVFGHHVVWLALHQYLKNPQCRKVAHNVEFEAAICRAFDLGPVDLESWDCTAARASRMGFPRSLEKACQAARVPFQKDMEGSRLMKQMAKPRKIDPDTGEIIWWDDWERLRRLAEYARADVEAERALDNKLAPLPPLEREIWLLTEAMNQEGVRIDRDLLLSAREAAEFAVSKANEEINDLTNGVVSSVTAVAAMARWVEAMTGKGVPSLDKAAVKAFLEKPDLAPAVRRVLELRQAFGKSSVAKIDAFLNRSVAAGKGAVVQGNLVYHRATTGRWAGSGVQLQNLPRPGKNDASPENLNLLLCQPREFVRQHGDETMGLLSRLLRSTIIASDEGFGALVRADYAAIEARGVAWLAGAKDMLRAFVTGEDVYKLMASKIYRVPVDKVTDDQRFVGKQVVLGCGYGMGAPKFITMCEGFGRSIDLDLAETAVGTYRIENGEIPRLWKGLERAALAAMRRPGKVQVFETSTTKVGFLLEGDILKCRLPSGRVLFYHQPEIQPGRFGNDQLTYMGENPTTRKWERESTWGGKLTENVVQAIARDIMADGLIRLHDMGLNPVLTVHDEAVCDTLKIVSPRHVEDILCIPPAWALDFPIKAEGATGFRYGK